MTTRLVVLDDASAIMLSERVDQVRAQVRAFASAWLEAASAGGDTVNVDAFLNDLAAHVATLTSARVAFAILRALEIDEDGVGAIDESRFEVDVSATGEIEATREMPEEQRRVARAAWLLKSLDLVKHVGLAAEDRTFCRDLRVRIEQDEVPSDAALLDLEWLVMKTHPEYALIATHEGREQLFANQRERAVRFLRDAHAGSIVGAEFDPGEARVVASLVAELDRGVALDVALPTASLPSLFRLMARTMKRAEVTP